MDKLTVDHYTAIGSSFICQCDDGRDRTVQLLELLNYLAADARGRITVTTEYPDTDGDVRQVDQYLYLPEWLELTDKSFICEVFSNIINQREKRTVWAKKPLSQADFLPTAGLQAILSTIQKPAA